MIITLAEGSVNYLTDSENYTVFTDEDEQEPDGTLFAKTNLVINGNGKLVIDSNYQDGIVSKDTLKIINAEIEVTSADDGIRGKDFVAINNAKITIEATKKGIRSTNTKDSSLGYILIDGGTININKSYEGIEARLIEINGGEIYINATGDGIDSNGSVYINGEKTASITVTGTVTANGSNQRGGNRMNDRNTKNFH